MTQELQRIYSNICDLPIGKSLTLAPLETNNDGYGGLIVKRHSESTFVFQREFYHNRSRWADDVYNVLHELETYLATGKLADPDKIQAF